MTNQVDADGDGFVVRYGDYLSGPHYAGDPWRLPRGVQLALAIRATPGAQQVEAKKIGVETVSGLMEDLFERYEWRVGPTAANVLALRAT